jgi:DNA-binding NarL/FixJ family response regulator
VTLGLRVAIIDSDEFVREGRVLLLQSQPETQIVYESGDANGALDSVADYLVDVVIVDTRIPGWKASNYLLELASRLQEDGNDAQILAITAFASPEFELACLRAGAANLVSNEQGVAELLRQVKVLGARESPITRARLEALMAASEIKLAPNPNVARSLNEMDSHQLAVVKAMLDGKSDTQIARELELSRYRVAKFIESLRVNSGLRTRQQLAIELLGFGTL